jgi:replicative DNA helicase
VLFASLTDVDALEVVARDGLDPECIPTEDMRQVVSWAVDRFFESGQTKAPSRAALLSTWSEVIDGAKVELVDEDEEVDNIEWALEDLRSRWVHKQFQVASKDAGRAMAEATPAERLEVLAEQVAILQDMSLRVQSHADRREGVQGIKESLVRYDDRALTGHRTIGLTFGLPMVDQHLFGVHPGELCVLAAPPATGKSFWHCFAALNEWRQGRRTVLFTLENSVEMTFDRMACLGSGVDARRYQRGLCTDEEVARVRAWVDQHGEDMQDVVEVIMPPEGARTVQAMVRQAQSLGGQSLLIDQLTFVEHPRPAGKARHEVLRDIMHELKTSISTGRHKMSCLLTHQINREGQKAAEKADRLEMYMLAEASEVERTADQVLGLYQSGEMRVSQQALLQVLKARREDTNAWDLIWRPAHGMIQVMGEAVLP